MFVWMLVKGACGSMEPWLAGFFSCREIVNHCGIDSLLGFLISKGLLASAHFKKKPSQCDFKHILSYRSFLSSFSRFEFFYLRSKSFGRPLAAYGDFCTFHVNTVVFRIISIKQKDWTDNELLVLFLNMWCCVLFSLWRPTLAKVCNENKMMSIGELLFIFIQWASHCFSLSICISIFAWKHGNLLASKSSLNCMFVKRCAGGEHLKWPLSVGLGTALEENCVGPASNNIHLSLDSDDH